MVTTIMACVSSASFSVLLNGCPGRAFKSSRVLSMTFKLLDGRRRFLIFSLHILFFRANLHEADVMRNILEEYQRASGQLINLDKSELSFSRNVPEESKHALKLPLLNISSDDKLVWGACTDGWFTVNSAYKAIKAWELVQAAGSSFVPQNSQLWKKLWKLRVPPRVAHLAWKILKGVVPTRKRLWNRGVVCPLWCPRCPGMEENLEHLFCHCRWSKEVWFMSPLGMCWDVLPADFSFSSWLAGVILQGNSEAAELACMLAYYVWRARNTQPRKLMQGAISEFYEYQNLLLAMRANEAAASSSRTQPNWKPPPHNAVKLNTDAALKVHGWAYGAILRDEHGEALAAQVDSDGVDVGVDFAEARAVWKGPLLAKEHNVHNLHVESDSAGVISAINGGREHTSYMAGIVQDILLLAQSFTSISFTHIGRDADKIAHNLAKLAASYPPTR
ncbi:hypothetical protein OROGR_018572 [Orobanche gracilis]